VTSTFSIGAQHTEPITISALEFDVLWEHLELGPLPLVVRVPSPGKTYAERAQLEQRAWADLANRGLGRQVDLHPELATMLHLLARPQREVDGRVYVDGGARLLAAAVDESAALVLLRGNYLTLRRIEASGLPSAALEVLPPEKPGPGQSVTLRTEDFEAAAKASEGKRDGFGAALQARGVRADDAKVLAEMIGDVTRTGNFGAAARDKLGRRRRADRVVSFFDTEEGRYMQVRRPAVDGSLWSTIAPADLRKLTFHVDELLTEVVDQVGG
jgi:ESX secretion-associated protein EspG